MVDAKKTVNSTLVFPDGRNIVHAERKIVYYLDRFKTFPRYDAIVPSSLNIITSDDRHIASNLLPVAAHLRGPHWSGDPSKLFWRIGIYSGCPTKTGSMPGR